MIFLPSIWINSDMMVNLIYRVPLISIVTIIINIIIAHTCTILYVLYFHNHYRNYVCDYACDYVCVLCT